MKIYTSTSLIYIAYAINQVFGFPVTEDLIAISNGQIPLHTNVVPSIEDGARVARTLVFRESLVNVNTFKTVKSGDDETQLPVSSMDITNNISLLQIFSFFQNLNNTLNFLIRNRIHRISK